MTEIIIRRYRAEDAEIWDSFVKESRNAVFMFQRAYMDYHAERFRDHSLMAYRNGRLAALLAANEIEEEKTLVSHGGLTFGGWLLPTSHFDANDMLMLMQNLCQYCRENNLRKIVYKAIPYIYSSIPAQEDIYALWRLGAEMQECNLSTAIKLTDNPGFSTQMRRHLKAAESKEKMHFAEVSANQLPHFHALLAQCLYDRHNAQPVHTLEELQLLMSRFPKNIRIFAVNDAAGLLHAAVMLYISENVAHCQYIATSDEGRKNHALPYLFRHLTDLLTSSSEFSNIEYFDFGTSNEQHGKILNPGLIRQKYALGGRAVAHQIFVKYVDDSTSGL